MCGIVAYIGFQPAAPIIYKCLGKLEYRGYDSCGLAVSNGSNLTVEKDTQRVAELQIHKLPLEGKIGLGHTRWATCGAPSRANAHRDRRRVRSPRRRRAAHVDGLAHLAPADGRKVDVNRQNTVCVTLCDQTAREDALR